MVYVFFADGFEEVEGLTAVDLVRRAGVDLRMVSVTGEKKVCGSHGIAIDTDMLIEDIDGEAEMLVLPGGMPGTTHLMEHEALGMMLKKQYEAGKWIAAICAAPSVFAAYGFLKGRKATSYPGKVTEEDCASYVEDAVAIDGNVVTSRGVGTAIPFALALIEILKDKETADRIASSIIYERL